MSLIWDPIIRDVPGYEELYQISEFGEVYSKITGDELKGWIDSHGYRCVQFWKNGKEKNLKVHRLLANIFIDNPENKSYVDHINGNRVDNRLENLRHTTMSENNMNTIRKNKLGITGVSKDGKGYASSIEKNGIRERKYFKNLDSAIVWRKQKEKELHGEFGVTNSRQLNKSS